MKQATVSESITININSGNKTFKHYVIGNKTFKHYEIW